MLADTDIDVPSTIDLRTMRDAAQWAAEVSSKRPWRLAFFTAFAQELRKHQGEGHSILELGSGPGFLAEYLLSHLRLQRYTALDFSDAMHALARDQLGPLAVDVEFLTRDFLDPAWADGLPHYSAVVTLQAVHELRHKRKASVLYAQVRELLNTDGMLLVCDHYFGSDGMKNPALSMSEMEHTAALAAGGFSDVACIHKEGGMVLYHAKPA